MIYPNGEISGSYENFVCVVGSGPVGITAALELEKLGLFVLLLESGSSERDPAIQELSDAARFDPLRHREMKFAVGRSFGGTSNLWGAGCIPFNPVDFERRAIVSESPWPIAYEEFETYLPAAADYAQCGFGFVRGVPGLLTGQEMFTMDRVVRFAYPPSFQKGYRQHIETSQTIHLYLRSTLTDIRFRDDGSVEELTVQVPGNTVSLRPRAIVLACGGVETTRILLSIQTRHPDCFGGTDGPLGRYYMGHLSGTIADIGFTTVQADRAFRFVRDADHHYFCRRIIPDRDLIQREKLTNLAFWPVSPKMADPSHKSSILSLAYLVLSTPFIGEKLLTASLRRMVTDDDVQLVQHLLNIATDLPALLAFVPGFLFKRFLQKPAVPGLQFSNRARKYALHYHAEHLPNRASRIMLDDECDRFGLRKVKLDLRFTEADAAPIVKSHKHLNEWLRQNQLGELISRFPENELHFRVLDQACDGVHQIGTVRMASNERDGVVDSFGRVFHCKNLFVSGSAIFPTSGQANPTLTAMALAVRQARFVAQKFR